MHLLEHGLGQTALHKEVLNRSASLASGKLCVPEKNTGMLDEAHYQAHVLKLRQALDLLEGCGMKDLARILLVGYNLWAETRQWELAHASSRAEEVQAGRQHAGGHVQGYRGGNGQS